MNRRYSLSVLGLLGLVLATRLPFLWAKPYFADGPRHIASIENGSLFIQPPGYFMFAATANVISTLASVDAASGIQILNVGFTLAGTLAFFRLTTRYLTAPLAEFLTACYALTNSIWFSSLVHSSYASMAFFSPMLLDLLARNRFVAASAIWAIGAGYRPSDGIFLLPMLLVSVPRQNLRTLAMGCLTAVIGLSVWIVPTFQHYGGGFGIYSSVARQLNLAAEGRSLVLVGITEQSLANVTRFVIAVFTSAHVLIPFAVAQVFRSWNHLTVLCIAGIAPGTAFLVFRYMSDAPYVVFLMAPVLFLAGARLGNLNAVHASSVLICAALLSSFHMVALRPLAPTSFGRRVLTSYSLQFTSWAVLHGYHRNLSALERDARDNERKHESVPDE